MTYKTQYGNKINGLQIPTGGILRPGGRRVFFTFDLWMAPVLRPPEAMYFAHQDTVLRPPG